MNQNVLAQMGLTAPTFTADLIIQSMQIRAAALRSEIAAIESKRAELAMLEKMIAAAKGVTDEVAGTVEVGSPAK